jgi:DNA-3-methyladenine glycosylase II
MNIRYNRKPIYWDRAKRFLIKSDSLLRKVIQSTDNKQYLTINSTPFQTLANAIIGQQVSVASASSMLKKLKIEINGFSPNKIKHASYSSMQNAGLSRQKIEYLQLLSEKFTRNPKHFSNLKYLDDDIVINKLVKLKGIGEWTAQMYLIFQLNRPNVMPMADIGFLNSAKKLYAINEPINENLHKISNNWGNYKTVAVWYIWRIIDPDVVQY